jgi:hypothetical protein
MTRPARAGVWVWWLFVGCGVAGGGGALEHEQILRPESVYLMIVGSIETPPRIHGLDAELDAPLTGSAELGLRTSIIRDDGAVVFDDGQRAARAFYPVRGEVAVVETTLVEEENCPPERSIGSFIGLLPETQEAVFECAEVLPYTSRLYAGGAPIAHCPDEMSTVAIGAEGVVLCRGAVVDTSGGAHPVDLEGLRAVRARSDGSFVGVVDRGLLTEKTTQVAIHPDGRVEDLAQYPALPAIDGRPVLPFDSVGLQVSALAPDGTYFQIGRLGDAAGPYVLFERRIDAPPLHRAIPEHDVSQARPRLLTGG